MIDRRQAGSGLIRRWWTRWRRGRASDPMADLIAEFGARVVSAAEASAAYMTEVSGAVSGWTAREGVSYEQGTAARRPVFNASNANFNGLGSVNFDGSETHYLTANAVAAAASGSAKPFTLAMLFRWPGTDIGTTAQTFWSFGVSTDNTPRIQSFRHGTAEDYRLLKANDAGTASTALGDEMLSQPCVRVIVCHGTTVSAWCNGALAIDASAWPSGAATYDRFTWGAFGRVGITNPAHMELCRTLVLDDAASSGEVATITEKLAQGSGIVL
jgi:hypothetical protein